MRKGLIANIYKSKTLGDCSNGGISADHDEVLVVLDEPSCQVFEERKGLPCVKIVRRILFEKEYVHAEPIDTKDKTKVGFMAGGTFIYSLDSRFSEFVNKYPVSLHDRQETQEEYDMLSR